MKNWKLFMWALKRTDIEDNDFKKSWKNIFLFGLMKLSGIKSADVWKICNEIKDEIDRRDLA